MSLQRQETKKLVLTIFRSSTPSFASCKRDTNRVVKRPSDFSCRLALLLPLPVEPFSDIAFLLRLRQRGGGVIKRVRGQVRVDKWTRDTNGGMRGRAGSERRFFSAVVRQEISRSGRQQQAGTGCSKMALKGMRLQRCALIPLRPLRVALQSTLQLSLVMQAGRYEP